MGLDISHDTWHGAYSAFMTWRKKVAELAGMPPLELMEGFYDHLPPNDRHLPTLYNGGPHEYSYSLIQLDKRLPIKWASLKENPLHVLLFHSDCDGILEWEYLPGIIEELEKLLPLFPEENAGGHIGNWRQKTQTFIDGCKLALSEQENLEFR